MKKFWTALLFVIMLLTLRTCSSCIGGWTSRHRLYGAPEFGAFRGSQEL